MIIECQACRTRFKLDESRIKGKGARIRCRKCGESIIVMKSDIPAAKPSPPVGKELFDLRSILREPERRPPVPPQDEVDAAFDRLLQTDPKRETAAKEPADPPGASAPALRDEVDAAFDRLLHPDRKGEAAERESAEPVADVSPPPREETETVIESPRFEEREPEPVPPSATEEPPPPAEREREAEPKEFEEPFAEVPPPFPEEIDASHESPSLREPESGREPPPAAEEPAPLPGTSDGPFSVELDREQELRLPAGQEESKPDREPAEFLILDDGSQDTTGNDEIAAGQAKPFDISEQLSQAPRWTLEEDAAPAYPETEPPSFTATPADSRAEAIQEELAGLAIRDPREETSPPEPAPPDPPPPKPREIERQPVVRPRLSKPSRRPSVALLALLFLTLAGGGAFLAFTETGQETLRGIVPGMESFWLGGKGSVRSFKVENPIGFFERGKASEKLFVIKGAVTNQGRGAKSGIRVRAELLDGNRKHIAEKTVYAGNVISDVRSKDREHIEAAMSNRFGDKLSNVDVSPGKSVPFMVVFLDPPEGIVEYRLEAMDGE